MADDSEYTEADIGASPSKHAPRPKTPRTPKSPKTPTGQHDKTFEPEDAEAALRKELEGVRGINESLEGVIATLERAGGNMNTVLSTVNHASTLLNSWTRILSQTEHNQRLILNPQWKGATADLAEQEADILRKQQLNERKAAEEERRREELRRRREEEEERVRLGGPSTRGTRGTSGVRGTRSRARAGSVARGGTTSNYRSDGTVVSSSRGTSNIGRGFGTTRGRSRGAK